MQTFPGIIGLEWADGNRDKNLRKRRVTNAQAGLVFFNEPLVLRPNEKRSAREARYAVFGVTDSGRRLAVVYTIRGDRLRVISARDMRAKERRFYEEFNEEDHPGLQE